MISHAEAAHRWAAGIEVERRQSSNVFTDNAGRIFSYGMHFCMGRIYNGVLFYTKERYSNSTSKHQGLMLSAASHFPRVACASQGPEYHGFNMDRNFIDCNLAAWRREVERTARKLQKARKPEIYINELSAIAGEVRAFCEALKIRVPVYFSTLTNVDKLTALKEHARKEAAREARAAERIQKAQEAAARRREREAREYAAMLKLTEPEKAAKFQAGKIQYYESEFQTIRYNAKSNRFETSKGVQIPLEIGKRFYQALKENLLQTGQNVLYYTIREVSEIVRVGCHNFKKDYLLEYGSKFFAEA